MSIMACKRGHILAVILMVVVVVTCLFSVLLNVPGSAYHYAVNAKKELQQIYDAESAIMVELYGEPVELASDSGDEPCPGSFLMVESRAVGPYREICAPLGPPPLDSSGNGRRLCVQTVGRFRDLSYRDWQHFAGEFRSGLYRRIEFAPSHRTVAGNRRIFSLDSAVSMHVSDGDLRLAADGRHTVASFIVEGDASVSGRASYDTLRIFAQGNVSVVGELNVSLLEIYAGGEIEIRGNATFRGIVFSQKGYAIGGKAKALYPSFAISMGFNDSYGSLADKASFKGLLAAPGGSLMLQSSVPYDSSTMVLPVFDQVEEFVFNRSLDW